ncbi:MAG: EAL domain-containing protein [Thiogranum sp.]
MNQAVDSHVFRGCASLLHKNALSANLAVIVVALLLVFLLQPRVDPVWLTDCKPEQLELEVTENVIVKETEQSIATLNELRKLGISLAIDDFGTGYSSLSYLKKLPVNKLKIDRSFVADIVRDPDDTAIIRAVIALGTSMNMDIIAEGIENEAQEAFLRAENCKFGQGFLYAKPGPAEDIEYFIRNQARYRRQG